MGPRHQTALGLSALVLWFGALVFPAATVDASATCLHPEATRGYAMLLIGALGFLDLQPEWFANPLIVIAAILWLRGRGDRWLGPVALGLALWSFRWSTMTADTTEYVCALGAGFYLWLAAAAVLAAGSVARWLYR